MKLIAIKCPNCGSKLEFTSNSKVVTCEYCGYDIMADDEVKRIKLEDAEQTGYELGKGMQRALLEVEETDDDPMKPPGNKEKLIQQLELLKAHLCKVTNVEKQMREARQRLEDTKNNNLTGCLNGCLTVILLFALFMYWIGSGSSSVLGSDATTLIIYVLAAMAIINIVRELFSASKSKNAKRIIKECEDKIAENRASAPVKFVVPELCNIQFIDSILEMLRIGRADSYKEALNLFLLDNKISK